MAFLDETAAVLGIDEKTATNTFIYLSPTHGVVIEGHKKIYELSTASITVLCHDGQRVKVEGENLEVKEISHREICIVGKVSSVEVK